MSGGGGGGTMKFKAIARSEKAHTKELASDVRMRQRNTAPEVHPFARAREYKRALNATKLDKVFARPFVGALDGHRDGVWCSAAPQSSLVQFLSGSCDGEIRLWDLASRTCVWTAAAHRGIVKGVSLAPRSIDAFASVGDDAAAHLWQLDLEAAAEGRAARPVASFRGDAPFTGVDHHWSRPQFATSSELVQVWDHTRSEPLQAFKWGNDATLSVRFNPAEFELLASTGRDRTIGLYDLRAATPLRKVMLAAYCSAMAWNPREPYHFVCGSEDGNLYSFDMRNLAKPTMIHKDHVAAVLAVGFSPTGREFVSGGYDRTVRIFPHTAGRSREVYHTRRMGRIWSVNFSRDAKFVLSGSDDANLRIWKAQASESLETPVPRQERANEYATVLKKRYAHMSEIKRIAKHRHVPKIIKKTAEKQREMRDAKRRKEDNIRRHSKGGKGTEKPARQAAVLKEVE